MIIGQSLAFVARRGVGVGAFGLVLCGGSVTDMSYMFSGAVLFNQPLESWSTASVVDMRGMVLR